MRKEIKEYPGKKILIVDDEAAIRDFLSSTLIYWGHRVQAAANGTDALHLFRGNSLDLVLTDLNMPGIDGWSLAMHVKEESPTTLVGLMTAQGIEDIRERLEGSSIDFALFKPFTLEKLETQLRQCWAK
jgi:CheY-like chemotaxis protein